MILYWILECQNDVGGAVPTGIVVLIISDVARAPMPFQEILATLTYIHSNNNHGDN